MTDNTQPEALRLATASNAMADEGEMIHLLSWHEIRNLLRANVAELRRQHARIAELEAQLSSSGFSAADMATAAAQGFRDGVASAAASAGSEPVAWKHDCAALLANDVELWIDACPHCGKPRMHATQAAHPSPPEGMVGGWTKASQQLPPCRDDQLYIGINTAGFAGVFNVVRVIHGNTYCLMEVAEESVSIMSDLDIWQPFAPPTTPSSAKGVAHG